MKEYTAEDCFILLGLFPHNYTTVMHHSRFPNITFLETQILSNKTRILGEFLAASGMDKIDFSIYKDTIEFVDHYLETGIFKKEKLAELSDNLKNTAEPFTEIVLSYQEAGLADENGFGAHITLFVPTYAQNLLTTCHMIEITSGKNKFELLRQLKAARRNDPDESPQPELV